MTDTAATTPVLRLDAVESADICGRKHRVWLATLDYNARARHVYEKIGFAPEGVMRQSDWVDGRRVDSVIYGILKHELRREEGDA